MVLEHIAARIRRRGFRREYRAMVAQWYADGGDARFRVDYDLDAGSVVLDLGGYEGQWAATSTRAAHAVYSCSSP